MATKAKTHRFELVFPWREKDGTSGCETAVIEAHNPRAHYGELRGEGEVSMTRHTAKFWAFGAQAVVAFMDLTGLRPCDDRKAVFGPGELDDEDEEEAALWDAEPPGFDHTRIWRAAGGRYVVTTEPYGERSEKAAAWCAGRSWACEVFPPRVGMWNPDGETGTRLVLISPGGRGAPIEPLIPVLLAGMPRWPSE
jgi:hypothetical protein